MNNELKTLTKAFKAAVARLDEAKTAKCKATEALIEADEQWRKAGHDLRVYKEELKYASDKAKTHQVIR